MQANPLRGSPDFRRWASVIAFLPLRHELVFCQFHVLHFSSGLVHLSAEVSHVFCGGVSVIDKRCCDATARLNADVKPSSLFHRISFGHPPNKTLQPTVASRRLLNSVVSPPVPLGYGFISAVARYLRATSTG